ncbi:hypothetical protein P9112_013893 [Eukaryota sp. TZLM1-RC]
MVSTTMNPLRGVVPGGSSAQHAASAAHWKKARKRFKFIRILFILDIIIMGVIFANAAFFDERLNQNISIESSSSISILLWIQILLSFIQAFISVSVLVAFEKAIKQRSQPLMKKAYTIKGIFLCLDLFLFAYPTQFRLNAAFIAVIIHMTSLTLLYRVYSLISVPPKPFTLSSVRSVQSLTSDESLKPEIKAALNTQNKLYQWVELEDIRSRWKRVSDRRTWFLIFVALILILVFGTWFSEWVKIFSVQGHFFTDQQLQELNDYSAEYFEYWPTYPEVQRVVNDTKVVVFIVDGLRYDYFESKNERLSNFITSSTFAPDSKVFHGKCLLPSFSVPNWMTLLTGAPPELTGVLGNLLVPETGFDSVYRTAQLSNTFNGLTASPWMKDLVSSHLKSLTGDGTVPTSFNTDSADSAHYADEERAKYLNWAVGLEGETEYDLFYAHFSDVDLQGHAFGVTTEWNTKDTYDDAVTNKTIIFENLIEEVDDDTIVIFVSDHGQVDNGGHGGYEEPILSQVPIAIYKKNSGFAANPHTGPNSRAVRNRDDYSLEDIAPTVNALLGLPIPRGSVGMIIDEALDLLPDSSIAYRDLYEQKKHFVKLFARRAGYVDRIQNNDHLIDEVDPSTLTNEEIVEAVGSMLEVYDEVRSDYYSMQRSRNIAVSILVFFFGLVLILYITQKFSAVNLKCLTGVRYADNYFTSLNKSASRIALVLVLAYFIITIPTFYIITRIRGFSQWDATLVHTPQVIAPYLASMFIPAVICVFLMTRIPQLFVTRPTNDSFTSTVLWVIGIGDSEYLSSEGAQFLFLIQDYLLLFVSLALLGLLIPLSTFSFIVPVVFRIPFVDGEPWNFRFKILTILLQALPLGITVLVQARKVNVLNPGPSQFDHVYLSFIRKFKHIYRAERKYVTSLEADQKLLDDSYTAKFDDIGCAMDILMEQAEV